MNLQSVDNSEVIVSVVSTSFAEIEESDSISDCSSAQEIHLSSSVNKNQNHHQNLAIPGLAKESPQ